VRRVTARMTRDAAICGLALREGQMEWAQSTS